VLRTAGPRTSDASSEQQVGRDKDRQGCEHNMHTHEHKMHTLNAIILECTHKCEAMADRYQAITLECTHKCEAMAPVCPKVTLLNQSPLSYPIFACVPYPEYSCYSSVSRPAPHSYIACVLVCQLCTQTNSYTLCSASPISVLMYHGCCPSIHIGLLTRQHRGLIAI